MTTDDQAKYAQERIEFTLSDLAQAARLALSHEDYQEALDSAERTIMTVLYDVWRTPPPRPGHAARAGTWEYVAQGPGHFRLMDDQGRFIGFIARSPSGEWAARMHDPSTPPPGE